MLPEEDVNPVPLNISTVSVIAPSLLTSSPTGTVCPWVPVRVFCRHPERVPGRHVAGGNRFGQRSVTAGLNTGGFTLSQRGKTVLLSLTVKLAPLHMSSVTLGKLLKPSVPDFLVLFLISKMERVRYLMRWDYLFLM